MVSFQRPVGAAADLRELEYVSALQQTQDDVVRSDGSVQDVDIQLFLKSRYGMDVSLDDIRRTIIESFGDGDGIDLSELASMLLIPTLLKADEQSKDQQQQEDDGILCPAPNLVKSVLGMILRDVTGSSEPPKLSISLLRDILLAYGEEEMSQDEGLLRDMMNAAGNEGDDFDAEAFSRALTSDVRLYNIQNEVTLTTNYHDVMNTNGALEDSINSKTAHSSLSDDSDDLKAIEGGMNEKHAANKKDAPATVRRFWSSPAIDFTACRYSSKYIVVLLWAGFVISYVAYFGDIIDSNTEYYFDNLCSSGTADFGCRIVKSILEWLFILATLAGFGIGYVALCSIGNGIEDTRKWTRLIAVLFMLFFCYFFFFALYTPSDENIGTITYVDEDGNVLDEEDVIMEKTESYQNVVYFIAVIVGSIIILLEFYIMFGDSVRKRCMKSASVRTVQFFTSSGIKAEAGNKRAAAVKINTLIDNAQQIHSFGAKDIDHGETSFGAGLLNFSVRGEQWEEAGGFLWTWKRLFNKDLFQEEGVWISARLVAGNFSQLLISAFVLTYGIAFTKNVVEEWELGNADPARYLYLVLEWFNVQVTIEEFANTTCDFLSDTISTDSATCTTIAQEAVNNAIQSVANSLYPAEKYMVKAPMIVATAVTFATCLSLVVVYIPSVASTTLQFRSGVIPFFRDGPSFELYRSRLDLVTILLGSMFWSSLYASALLGIIVGGILFLFLWQATRTFFVNLVAVLIALVCTITIKIIISVFLLRKAYIAFYRKKLNQANIVSLALECIMVGFAVGTALARAIKLVLIAALYIGRVDTPLLAPGVGVGPLRDTYPFIFRQDILALEAHRHPYIELVGKLYLMKLKYGGRFADRAGYCYRLVFTVALLPWLRKYRVIAGPNTSEGHGDSGVRKSLNGAAVARASILLPRSSILHQSAQMASINSDFYKSADVITMTESTGGQAESEFEVVPSQDSPRESDYAARDTRKSEQAAEEIGATDEQLEAERAERKRRKREKRKRRERKEREEREKREREERNEVEFLGY